MKPYTKTGDNGETSLLNQRIKKTDNKIICIGSLDEAAAAISKARTELEHMEMTEILLKTEKKLNKIAGIIALSNEKIHEEEIKKIEENIDKYHIQKENFTRPKTEAGALLDFARTICRRAEINYLQTGTDENIMKYLNRLSDLLFVMRTYYEEKENQY
jgi:cob(I)alamin adenosyltransferase